MCSAPSSSEPQSFGVTAEKMHHGLVNSACRKTPPLRRMTRRRSESASIGRKPRGGHLGFRCPEQDIRRARHSSVAPFRLYPPADKQLCSGAFGPSEQQNTMLETIMRTLSNTTIRLQSVATRPSELFAKLQSWWVAFLNWRIQREAILQLEALSDRDLHDIGLRRCEIEGAVKSELNEVRALRRRY